MKNRKVLITLVLALIFLIFLPIVDVNAKDTQCSATDSSIHFCNPLSFETVEGVLRSLLTALQRAIVAIAIVFIVVGAILYITSSGDEKRIETAKKAITASMIGLAIGIASPSFLKEIYDILGGNSTTLDCSNLTGSDKSECEKMKEILNSAPSIVTIIMNVLNFLLSIVGALAIIMLVVGGIRYLTAAGNEDTIEESKKLIKYAIIGIIVALAALVIVKQIANFFTQ